MSILPNTWEAWLAQKSVPSIWVLVAVFKFLSRHSVRQLFRCLALLTEVLSK